MRRFCELYQFTVAEAESFIGVMSATTKQKGEIVVEEGCRDTNLYLLIGGIWRAYMLKDGEEITVWFGGTGEVVCSMWGYVANIPSEITIESLTESEVYYIPKQELEKYFTTSLAFANLGRKLIEHHALIVDKWWIDSWQPITARERYLRLMKKNPELLLYAPLKHVASYLGMTPQSLSRIRAALGEEEAE